MPAADLPPAKADDPPAWELPQAYAKTRAYARLRMAQIMGVAITRKTLDELSAGEEIQLLAFAMVREAEDARHRAGGLRLM